MNSFSYRPVVEPLTRRELQILRRLSKGLSNREIANDLVVTQSTVKWYNKQIYRKLGVNSRTKAVAMARKVGILEEGQEPETSFVSSLNHNLPAQVTSFIGRELELKKIEQTMGASRLVTLTGAGGSGKTRLAIEAAAKMQPRFRDGVWLVELAKFHQPSQVLHAIAGVLNLELSSDVPVVEALKRSLRRKQLLLLLDNFEHLLETGNAVGELLEGAPQLSVLATSRERLHIYGEHEFPVLPFDLSGLDSLHSPEQLEKYPAVRLFAVRAQAAEPGFELTRDNLPAVVRICQLLDGLPLAIELCAPQVKMFSPEEIAGRLESNLDSLPAGPHNLPARQRTMQATLDWSRKLLNKNKSRLFMRLAVFSGGGTLVAIEKICSQGLSGSLLNNLISLVDRNLVTPREGRTAEMRFTLLGFIREINSQQLQQAGEEHKLRLLHAAYYVDLAEQAHADFSTHKHRFWFAHLQDESDNIRSALSWMILNGEVESGLRMVGAIRDYWNYFGLAAEGRRFAEKVLERAHQAPSNLHAGALMALGSFCANMADLQNGKKYLHEALQIFDKLGDENNAAWCKIFLSGASLESQDDIQTGYELANQSLLVFQESNDTAGVTRAYNALGELARLDADYDAAEVYYNTCLELCIQSGEKLREIFQYINLGMVAYHKKEFHRSEQLHIQGLKQLFEMDSSFGMASHLASLAGPTAALGQGLKAARMLGAADVELESLGAVQLPTDQPEIKLYKEKVKLDLGEDAYQKAWSEGASMNIREAIRYAIEESDSSPVNEV